MIRDDVVFFLISFRILILYLCTYRELYTLSKSLIGFLHV